MILAGLEVSPILSLKQMVVIQKVDEAPKSSRVPKGLFLESYLWELRQNVDPFRN